MDRKIAPVHFEVRCYALEYPSVVHGYLFYMALFPRCSCETEDVKQSIYLVNQKRLRIVESMTRARVMKQSLCAIGLS